MAEIAGPERQGRTVSVTMSILYAGLVVLPPLFGRFVDHTHSWPGAWIGLPGVLVVATSRLLRVGESSPARPNAQP